MCEIILSEKKIYLWETVSINIKGLTPNTYVQLVGKAYDNAGVYYESSAHFIANESGEVNTCTDKSLEGTYIGIDQMGIFWSMEVRGHDKAKEKKHYMPETVKFEAYVEGKLVADACLERLLINDNVKITPVVGNGMFAEYYAPNGEIKKNNIIAFGGSDGTIASGRRLARYLSSQGFGVLALAYFKEVGLPDNLVSIPIESIGKAIDWLRTNCSPNGKIGITGISRGGEFSLLAASYYKEITCVAALTPANVMWESEDVSGCYPSWSYNKVDLPFLECDYPQELRDVISKGEEPFECGTTYVRCLENAKKDNNKLERCTIKVENINGNILMVSGKDDMVWPAHMMCNMAVERLKAKGFSHKYKHVTYDNVGHRVYRDGFVSTNPNYNFASGLKLIVGGIPKDNAHAQMNTRKEIKEFFKENLDENAAK